MNKQIAIDAIKFLNKVEITGHRERESMNAVCDALLAIVNSDEQLTQDKDGETDA